MGEDRISSLPDSILHHILSYLDTTFVVQTSVLSTKWRYLWTSVQFLNFDNQIFNRFTSRPEDSGQTFFMDFGDGVLRCRRNFDIQRFNLRYYYDGLLVEPIELWIVYAVEHNVRELSLTIYSGERIELPCCMFTCKSLVSLELNLLSEYKHELNLPLHLPVSVCLPSVSTMHLQNLMFEDEQVFSKLFSGCPILESLTVRECDLDHMPHLCLSAPKLKNFTIVSILDDEYAYLDEDCVPDGCKLQINAPNLRSLVCHDFMFREFHLCNCLLLEKAHIDMQFMEYYEYEYDPEMSRKHLAVNEKVYIQRIQNLLAGAANVRSLTLSAPVLEYLSEHPAFETVPTQLRNLKYLRLELCLSRRCIRLIVHLLTISPSIETFILDLTKICHTEDPAYPYWDEDAFDSGNLAEYREAGLSLHQLKFVKMQNVLGCINELRFLEILFEAALFMEKLVIYASPSLDRARIPKFSEKLLAFPQASSSLSISFF